ncbi:MAG: hypothetical protein HN869_01105 [Verrucomicrobia bacterium]|nr:hypothetical protein [Verrucomicrobiota bacterium]
MANASSHGRTNECSNSPANKQQPPFSPIRSGPKAASKPSRQKQFPSSQDEFTGTSIPAAWNNIANAPVALDDPNNQLDYDHTASTIRRFLDFNGLLTGQSGYLKASISNFTGASSIWFGSVGTNSANNANYAQTLITGNGTYELFINKHRRHTTLRQQQRLDRNPRRRSRSLFNNWHHRRGPYQQNPLLRPCRETCRLPLLTPLILATASRRLLP